MVSTSVRARRKTPPADSGAPRLAGVSGIRHSVSNRTAWRARFSVRIQATDSRASGCTAKSAATARFQSAPVRRRRHRNRRITFSAWMTGWWRGGRRDCGEKRHVQHVGEPGYWMPVGSLERRQCPGCIMPGQTLLHMIVGGDVDAVIYVE